MGMRTMTHHGRGKGRAGHTFGSKHDDRNFDITKASNIDPELTKNNLYWSIIEGCTFEEAEVKFYEDSFSEQLQATNDKYIANGHPERCKDMAAWKKIRQHAPEESVYQIGDKHNTGEHADAFTLYQCFILFLAEETKWNQEHGNPFTLLNYALHVDEPGCPPHIHSRKVWHYQEEDGTLRLGQERALELAGVELPHPDKPFGRYNNRKITYDAMMREKWLDILQSYELDIEREPLPSGKGKKSKTKEAHIREKYDAMVKETAAMEKKLEEARKELEELSQIKDMAQRDQVASEAWSQLDELQSAIDVADNFYIAAKQDVTYGGFNLKVLVEDFVFDWGRIRDSIIGLAISIKEKIRSIDIFEKLKKVLQKDRVADVLQDSLDKKLAKAKNMAEPAQTGPSIEQGKSGI